MRGGGNCFTFQGGGHNTSLKSIPLTSICPSVPYLYNNNPSLYCFYFSLFCSFQLKQYSNTICFFYISFYLYFQFILTLSVYPYTFCLSLHFLFILTLSVSPYTFCLSLHFLFILTLSVSSYAFCFFLHCLFIFTLSVSP